MNPTQLQALLCKGEFSSLSISFNDHKTSYHTAATAIEWRPDWYDDESFPPGERERCIATNTIWTLQWHPQTPVGSHVIHASSFEAIVEWLSKVEHQ